MHTHTHKPTHKHTHTHPSDKHTLRRVAPLSASVVEMPVITTVSRMGLRTVALCFPLRHLERMKRNSIFFFPFPPPHKIHPLSFFGGGCNPFLSARIRVLALHSPTSAGHMCLLKGDAPSSSSSSRGSHVLVHTGRDPQIDENTPACARVRVYRHVF